MTSTRTMGRDGATLRVRGWDGTSLGAGTLGGADPLGFAAGDANLYRYVGNDPVNDTDPTGLADDKSPLQIAKDSITNSDFGKTKEGKKVLKKIEQSRIIEGGVDDGTRGQYVGQRKEIHYNRKYYRNPNLIASELVHEACHAVYYDEHPRSQGNSVTQEVYTNTNQLRFYEEQKRKNPKFTDPDLEKRLEALKNGTLEDNIRSRYGDDFPYNRDN